MKELILRSMYGCRDESSNRLHADKRKRVAVCKESNVLHVEQTIVKELSRHKKMFIFIIYTLPAFTDAVPRTLYVSLPDEIFIIHVLVLESGKQSDVRHKAILLSLDSNNTSRNV
jgi:hypothetical protein